jgi:hypothetical protein
MKPDRGTENERYFAGRAAMRSSAAQNELLSAMV